MGRPFDLTLERYAEIVKDKKLNDLAEKLNKYRVDNDLKEIDESKKKIALLNEEKYNRLRLIEINNYYGSQYSTHQKIILYFIFLCIIFLILIILKNKNILSADVFFWVSILIISISLIVIGLNLIFICWYLAHCKAEKRKT